jgi:Predicted metal-dependent hydrolase with the TIM-barrel fold
MVNTVTGPIASDQLGQTLMHEHFVFGYPGFAGDRTFGPFDRANALEISIAAAKRAKAHGIRTVVDATPNECGRDVTILKEVSEASGVNIICATGFYYEGEGAPAYFKFRNALGDGLQEVYEMMLKEVTEGIEGTGIKAGVIKLASSKGVITDYEKMFFRAAAKVQKDTGVVIITHTQEGTMGPDQAQFLISEGADPKKIMIGHMCGNTDIQYAAKVLDQGVYIGFDRFGLENFLGAPRDIDREALAVALIALGYGDKIMFSHDTVNVMLGRPVNFPPGLAETMANAHIARIPEVILPGLKKMGVTDAQIEQIMVKNPGNIFG